MDGGRAPSETDRLRFSIEFSDGRKVTNVHPQVGYEPEADPSAAVMVEQDGAGETGEWRQTYWIAPLPPLVP